MTHFWARGGASRPHSIEPASSVEMVSDEADILQSLDIILSTQLGERVLRPHFGCDLSQFLFEEATQGIKTRLKGIVEDALLYHESRIKVESIHVTEDSAEPGLLLISIDYMVRQTNSTYNRVYPFYLTEAA